MTKMTNKQKAMRANARSKPGRKPMDPGGETMKVRHVRMTDAQWAAYHALGGIQAFRVWLEQHAQP